MDKYQPPITITNEILYLATEISQLLAFASVDKTHVSNPRLRRDSRVKTIHSSLAIENNTLSIEQVTAIIGGKRVLGKPQEIAEVKNAYEAYQHMLEFDPYSVSDMLKAHSMMMSELVSESGMFRSGGVGVFNGERLLHIAPPAKFVSGQICNLLDWVRTSTLHPLVKSCVFHYEFEYIHPFADGNGRMGRMWQTLLLSQYSEVFEYLPVESIIKERQEDYYKALSLSDGTGDSVYFVEFMLEAICDALKEVAGMKKYSANTEAVMLAVGDDILSAKEIMARLGKSHMPTFRKNYLAPAILEGGICMTQPDTPNSRKQKYYKK